MSKKRNKKKRVVWIIIDSISNELWGEDGWFTPPGDVLVFESEKEAQDVYNKEPCKRLCSEIVEYPI